MMKRFTVWQVWEGETSMRRSRSHGFRKRSDNYTCMYIYHLFHSEGDRDYTRNCPPRDAETLPSGQTLPEEFSSKRIKRWIVCCLPSCSVKTIYTLYKCLLRTQFVRSVNCSLFSFSFARKTQRRKMRDIPHAIARFKTRSSADHRGVYARK